MAISEQIVLTAKQNVGPVMRQVEGEARQAAGNISKAFQGAGGGQSMFAGIAKDLKGFGEVALKATGAIAGVGAVLKGMMEVGEAGAAVRQTRESFDLLLQSVGAGPRLFDELQRAAGGTISNLQLMSSTATLLAGAQGDLAYALAEATPELMEIARAAQKLNPTLGDTTFLYESLAVGIKRASPLILDNLGLTVRVGEANEAMAKALGKSVEELTAEEQKMALLNATLEAGRVLVSQVGGNVESAVDPFKRLETAGGNLADALKERLAPALAQAAEAGYVILTWDEQIQDAFAQQETRVRATAASYEEYAKGALAAAVAAGKISEGVAQTLLAALDVNEDYIASLGVATRAEYDRTQAMQAANSVMDGEMERIRRLQTDMRAAAGATEEAAGAMDGMAGATRSATTALKGFNLTGVDPNIGADIARAIDQIKFALGGGGDLQSAFEDIQNKLALGLITPQQAQQAFEALYAESQVLQTKLGEITAEQAAQNIANTLGVSLEEAMAKVEALKTAASFSAVATIYLNVVGQTPQGGGNYTPPKPKPGGGGGKPAPGFAFAQGTDFVIPPGYPDDSYPIGWGTSGEHVRVTPAGQAGGGGISIGEVNVYAAEGMDVEDLAAAVLRRISEAARVGRAAGMGYAR